MIIGKRTLKNKKIKDPCPCDLVLPVRGVGCVWYHYYHCVETPEKSLSTYAHMHQPLHSRNPLVFNLISQLLFRLVCGLALLLVFGFLLFSVGDFLLFNLF